MTRVFEVFWRFLVLGCGSFGGPVAHLGYFQQEFVSKRQWLSKEDYAQLVVLSQVMPGPGSSQVGFAIGFQHAGLKGAIAAFIGFTLPSMVVMLLAVWLQDAFQNNAYVLSVIHLLKLMAIVVVADACWSMAKQFCASKTAQFVALGSIVFLFFWPFGLNSLWLILIAVAVGFYLPIGPTKQTIGLQSVPYVKVFLWVAIGLLSLSFITVPDPFGHLFLNFYQAGSLVFGGGHVVLPLLQSSVEGVSNDVLLVGYAAAQAVPGPMFTMATFLGGALAQAEGLGLLLMVTYGVVATLGVFLPGLLWMLVAQHYWATVSKWSRMTSVVMALNAAVVGLLIYTLVSPVMMSSLQSAWDGLILIVGFVWLNWRRPPILVLLSSFVVLGCLFVWLG